MNSENFKENTSRWEKIKTKFQPIHAKWLAFKTARPKTAWTTLIGGSLALFGVLFVLTFYSLVRFEVLGSLPNQDELMAIENSIASEVYSEDEHLLGKYYVQNRVNANLEEISPILVDALVATEDARFFDHSGVDFRSWFRVLFKSILLQDDDSGGGSTLSQQLAKNIFKRKRYKVCLLYTSPSPRDATLSRMPSSA